MPALEHRQARSPSACMRACCFGVAIGCTSAASHALATAPCQRGDDTALGSSILLRVIGSPVGKIQVGTACRASCLTHAKVNCGGLQAAVPRVPSPVVQVAYPLCPEPLLPAAL